MGARTPAAARRGRGGALFILGEVGLGKTSVLHEACRQAGDDVAVGMARCDPMEESLAFGSLAQVARDVGAEDAPWTAEGMPGRRRQHRPSYPSGIETQHVLYPPRRSVDVRNNEEFTVAVGESDFHPDAKAAR